MVCSSKVRKTTTNKVDKSDKKNSLVKIKATQKQFTGVIDKLRQTFVSYLESGYLVRVARLLVYMCPPTSMCTGAFALVS